MAPPLKQSGIMFDKQGEPEYFYRDTLWWMLTPVSKTNQRQD